jgi:hypothetical protein
MRTVSKIILVGVVIIMFLMALRAFSQTIEPARQAQITRALRQHGYRGTMEDGLRQVAREHHWQTRAVPDSRVLIFLGLGANYKSVLNPRTAWLKFDSPAVVTARK